MKITKATVKRINDHSYVMKAENIIPAIDAIGEVLNQCGLLIGEPGHYEINSGDEYVTPLIFSDGKREFVSGTVRGDYTKKVLRGLCTRYPRWLSCTFTHGLNGVTIYEPNKLVKAILDEG